jgi:hypothetical protein
MLSPDFLNTAVPLGLLAADGSFKPLGSGVLVARHELAWLVTARHVKDAAAGASKDQLVLVGTTKSGEQFPMHLQKLAEDHDIDWIETDKEEDLTAIPVPLSQDWVHRTIPEGLCLTGDAVIPSMPCYTLGIPYGLSSLSPGRITPLVLDGVVSGIDQDRGLLYISAPTFKGNSGGPVFVYRSPFDPGGGLTVGNPPILFAGIVIQQMLVSGASSASDPVIASPPLHLGVVRTAERILFLLDGKAVMTMSKRLTGR